MPRYRANITPMQKKFADQYIKLGSGTAAAVKAGYAANSAKVTASRLLTKTNIQEYIDSQTQKLDDRNIADAAEVMQYLTRVLRGEESEEVLTGVGESKNKQLAAKDRLKAAELIGRRYQLFRDKMDVEVTNVVKISDLVGDLDDD